MDGTIEERVSGCHVCVSVPKSPPKTPLHPWKWPAKWWERVHFDFLEKEKLNFLVVIDAYSKWLEVKPMSSMTSLKSIDELRILFALYGIPEEVVSSNGPQLAAEEFIQFIRQICVKFPRVPRMLLVFKPYYRT